MRYWVSVSLLAFAFVSVAAQQKPEKTSPLARLHRQNELTLAGIRPGETAMARVLRRYGLKPIDGNTMTQFWHDDCQGLDLFVDADKNGEVQSVRISEANTGEYAACEYRKNFKTWWVTGKYLKLQDPAPRVLDIYGKPDSRSPSTKGGQQLELLYYAFDWAGPDVPQVMEVLCTVEKDGKPGRVVEITLAAPSL